MLPHTHFRSQKLVRRNGEASTQYINNGWDMGGKVEVRDLPGTSVGYGGIESTATVGDVTGRLAGHVTRG